MIKFIAIVSFLLLLTSYSTCLDPTCESQKEVIGNAFKKEDPISKYFFTNDSKTSVEVTWLGDNSGKIIFVTTSELLFNHEADIYLSENNGKSFLKITGKLPLSKIVVHKENGLQRSTTDTNMVFLVCYDPNGKSVLVLTHDGGITWKKSPLNFILDKLIVYHATNKMLLLTLGKDNNLYQSMNGGLSWSNILQNVFQFQWSSLTGSDVLFAKTGSSKDTKDLIQLFFESFLTRQTTFSLKKYDGKSWKDVKNNIFGFIMKGRFLYISEILKGNRRRLTVSMDEGKSFNRVYLPTIMDSQFYSFMDIDDDLVFIHVDNEDANGDGTLFTSDSEGRVFSQSLLNHFYPSQSYLSDFYKIESMRGTYIASQLNPDKSIQTLITFNRGAEWRKLNKPESELCHDKEKTECYLQIANSYSVMQKVMSYLPLSSKSAVGLVLAHGHLAESLKTSKADVYVSSDGGYNWMKALTGPHQYVIADHGGLLVALGENKKIIKFSTDEGRCWHEHQYTSDDIMVTGILTEPGNKAMTVAIWGYLTINNQWSIHVVDLSQVLNRECTESDYEKWFPHSEMLHPSGKQYFGCLFGKKETFERLKKDSLCRNGYSHILKSEKTICPCTEDDFECEYGYYRAVNSKSCVRNQYIKEDLCINGTEEKILTQGYKKIPSDVCEGGFTPIKTKQRALNVKCNADDHSWQQKIPSKVDEKVPIAKTSKQAEIKNNKTIYIIIGITGSFIGVFLVYVIVIRTRNIRRRQSSLKYRILAGIDRSHNKDINGDDDAALLSNEVGYNSTGQTQIPNGNMRNKGDDSDVDLIG